MFRFLIVSFLFTVACSGSGSSSATHVGTDPNATPKSGNSCNAPDFSFYDVNLPTRTGTANATLNGTPYDLVEMTCETLRDKQGAAVGYAASFTDSTTQPTAAGVVRIDHYVGNGVYNSAFVQMRTNGVRYGKQYNDIATVTVSQNGKHAIADSEDGALHWEYSCDSTDDTSTTATSALADPVAGTAYAIMGDTNRVYKFQGVTCEFDSYTGKLIVRANSQYDADNLEFELDAAKAEPGAQNASLLMNYFNIDGVPLFSGTVALSCAARIGGAFTIDDAGCWRAPRSAQI
jgi:hypothetical protein